MLNKILLIFLLLFVFVLVVALVISFIVGFRHFWTSVGKAIYNVFNKVKKKSRNYKRTKEAKEGK